MGKKVEKAKSIWEGLPNYVKTAASVVSALMVLWGAVTGAVNMVSERLNDKIDSKVDTIVEKVESIELDTQRIQLLYLMGDDNASVKSVLEVAEKYFCVLGGDSYVLHEFEQWAERADVNVQFVLQCHRLKNG